jgi:hypothetical protein
MKILCVLHREIVIQLHYAALLIRILGATWKRVKYVTASILCYLLRVGLSSLRSFNGARRRRLLSTVKPRSTVEPRRTVKPKIDVSCIRNEARSGEPPFDETADLHLITTAFLTPGSTYTCTSIVVY